MIDRTRLAVSGAILAVIAFSGHAGLSWTDYAQARDSIQTEPEAIPVWVPTYWIYLRNGLGLTLAFLTAIGIGMVIVAIAMRPPVILNDAPIHPEPPDDALFRPEA